jgi:hypothetical protein
VTLYRTYSRALTVENLYSDTSRLSVVIGSKFVCPKHLLLLLLIAALEAIHTTLCRRRKKSQPRRRRRGRRRRRRRRRNCRERIGRRR